MRKVKLPTGSCIWEGQRVATHLHMREALGSVLGLDPERLGLGTVGLRAGLGGGARCLSGLGGPPELIVGGGDPGGLHLRVSPRAGLLAELLDVGLELLHLDLRPLELAAEPRVLRGG
eukprot:CAMPEP_0182853452 /NCGR_PEP_ID=MMETSP0034_2-20130328/706_1 /TAXON_ID=156128 /ORGANISM="Nephroselmis pyriformis, Strain CCMP717" /LENGTH=117 /DNA_ID=CAMNT_0024984223 /DNA_START=432 /DNA_END=781 /DNA_ORIENTATION=-